MVNIAESATALGQRVIELPGGRNHRRIRIQLPLPFGIELSAWRVELLVSRQNGGCGGILQLKLKLGPLGVSEGDSPLHLYPTGGFASGNEASVKLLEGELVISNPKATGIVGEVELVNLSEIKIIEATADD